MPRKTKGHFAKEVTASDLLFKAIKSGNIDNVRFCLENGVDVNYTPIYIAACGGELNIVKLLKENGADLNMLSVYGKNTPLYVAANNEHIHVVKYLLENGADLHFTIKNCFFVDFFPLGVRLNKREPKWRTERDIMTNTTKAIKTIINQVIITEKDEEKFMPPEEDRLTPDDKYTWKINHVGYGVRIKDVQTWSLKEFYKCGVCHEWKSKEKIEEDVPVKSFRCQHYYCAQCASKIDTCPECRRPFQIMSWVQKRMQQQVGTRLGKRRAEEMMI